MTSKSHVDIDEDILTSWGSLAAELIRVEKMGDWKRFGSFSGYIANLAEATKKTKSSFWRVLSAGHDYLQLRKKLDPAGKHLPKLDDPAIKASPESLEILRKISRVAPTELVTDLERRTMDGTISRRELRNLWETYRPVLGGKTARGRGMPAPRYDKKNWGMRRKLIEANILAQIVQNGPEWLPFGNATVDVYKVVHISGNDILRGLYPSAPDMVVLYADQQTPLTIHGIEAVSDVRNNAVLRHYDEKGTVADCLWFATAEPLGKADVASIPEEIGLLLIKGDSVEVVRSPQPAWTRRLDQEDFLRALLRETAKY